MSLTFLREFPGAKCLVHTQNASTNKLLKTSQIVRRIALSITPQKNIGAKLGEDNKTRKQRHSISIGHKEVVIWNRTFKTDRDDDTLHHLVWTTTTIGIVGLEPRSDRSRSLSGNVFANKRGRFSLSSCFVFAATHFRLRINTSPWSGYRVAKINSGETIEIRAKETFLQLH